MARPRRIPTEQEVFEYCFTASEIHLLALQNHVVICLRCKQPRT
jgi:hypothetical protein